MAVRYVPKEEQGQGAFNGGEIVENKPIGFPQDGGALRAFSNIFYWANAEAKVDSTIGLHPHKGFEIISFVLAGSIRHFDTQMNAWKELHAGDVQIIRAGNGISHAEHMNKDARMFQIWVDPNLNKTLQQDASYSDYKNSDFPEKEMQGNVEKTYIGGDSIFKLDSEGIVCKRVKVNSAYSLDIAPDKILSAYILTEGLHMQGSSLAKDSFVQIEDETFTLDGRGEMFYFLTPRNPSYRTYASQMV